jgi:2-hydroxy-3-oxopropionate reductase
MKVAIIGTGLMGYPMAQNISKKFQLKSYNRTFDRMNGLEKNKITLCKTLKEVCEESEVIITMLPGDEDVSKVMDEIKDLINQNSTVIDMSSTKVITARNNYNALKNKNINFLDAPVSGGPEGAKSASLAIMVGGDEKIFNFAKEVLNTMGNATLVGPNGSGQVAKLCNQIIVGVTIGAVAEAVILCENNGADPKKFIEAVKGGFADSKILQNHGNRMISKDFNPRGKNVTHLKDMNNILESAKQNQIDLPFSNLIRDMFNSLCESGFQNDDHSSLYKEILRRNKK